MRSRFVPRRATLLLALFCATALLGGGACREQAPAGDAARVRVTIPAGTSFRAAADSLERAGLIRSSRLFRAYASFRRQDRALKAGTYEFAAGTGWDEMLASLTRGRGLVATITIPEGFGLREIVPLLARRLEVPEDSVRAAVRDSALRATLQVPTETLEGYVFPETYTFPLGTSARVAVTEMVRLFERRWRPAWNERLQELGRTRHEIVTLASIVEKEARVADERPLIAAVYTNRLRINMPLQADPTVVYALGAHVDRVLYGHLDVDSPYNTYRNAGLPPGPIASPGTPSIEAALHPAEVPYLYFVARPDGRHEFRTTFAEHTEARALVRREAERLRRQQEQGAATPAAPSGGDPGARHR